MVVVVEVVVVGVDVDDVVLAGAVVLVEAPVVLVVDPACVVDVVLAVVEVVVCTGLSGPKGGWE
ncbi:MAG: hypothetical protein M0Z92_04905 [Actinomycetota bacterium]|nr:hypothetical protein [Actinomycetota bacterium]